MAATLFHTADLHLAEDDAEYCLAVLDELVEHCARLRPDAWLLCGDLFNTHRDLLALAAPFRERMARLEGTPVIMIPGNHELLPAKRLADLPDAPFEPVTLVREAPYAMVRPQGSEVEVMAVPFRRDFSDYLSWPLPERRREFRVAMLHGVVNGMTYLGESEEAEQAVIDPDLFVRFGLDFAALGHIHNRHQWRYDGHTAHYPGSARVWRKGESGTRFASLVRLEGDEVDVEGVAIAAAGEFLRITLPIDEEGRPVPHGSAERFLEVQAGAESARDWLSVTLTGFVETPAVLQNLVRALELGGQQRFRKFDVETGGVLVGERLRNHPLVQAFEARWRRARAAAQESVNLTELRLLERARQLALEQVRARLEEG